MKRLGFWSGNIYDENKRAEDLKECCLVLSDYEEVTPELIQRVHKDCPFCTGCPLAKEEEENYD